MRIRSIAALTAAVLSLGVGVAWAAIPNSDGSVDLCAGTQTTPSPTGLYGPVYMTDSGTQCQAGQIRAHLGATGPAGARGADGATGPAGAAAAVPQVYEAFISGNVSLNNKALTASLSLPAGTYDVDAAFAGSALDIHEVARDANNAVVAQESIFSCGCVDHYDVVPRAMSVNCHLDTPGRTSLSVGAAPLGSGAFSANDHATIALTAPATLTFTCLGDDWETTKQSTKPQYGQISASGSSHISATMISSSAVPAVIRTEGVITNAATKAQINKLVVKTDPSDSGNDKKLSQILTKVKALSSK